MKLNDNLKRKKMKLVITYLLANEKIKVLKKLQEEDFAVLRGPLESNRQSPSSLGPILILSIPLQTLLIGLEFYIGQYSYNPYASEILLLHLLYSCILAMASIGYAIPKIYKRYQKAQYLVSILVSQNMGAISFYMLAIMALGEMSLPTKESIEGQGLFVIVTLAVGLFVLIATSIRFYLLLQKGKYRKGSEKEAIRTSFEKKSLLPISITLGTGVVFIIQFLIRNFQTADVEKIFFVILAMLIYYTMLFVLPEQLVILYCKYRFQSFNFRLDERLYPLSFEEEK